MTKLEAAAEQFEQALKRLGEALRMPKTDIVRDSAIQRFEFSLDLAWKTVKAFLEEKHGVRSASPKECFREAYRHGLIGYTDEWLRLVDMRNETVHTYNQDLAEKIFSQLPRALECMEELLGAIKINSRGK
ncbi:MAG: nucleotidyltransferase substrate binding protein [Candidatus Omnitrophica bacterium]|nr:nucleotidyltransferase substrate binding protein [Candidatus Omnitrophota bacterium]